MDGLNEEKQSAPPAKENELKRFLITRRKLSLIIVALLTVAAIILFSFLSDKGETCNVLTGSTSNAAIFQVRVPRF